MYALIFSARLLVLLFLASCSSNIQEVLPPVIHAKVIAIKDGDTIEVLYKGKPLRVRFAHIDCPEIRRGQPYAKVAKQLASSLCFAQEVSVLNEAEFDRYGRLIGVIINNKNQNINKEMLRAGLAWHYKQYSTDRAYARLEVEARNKKIGLWGEAFPTAPWEWRNGTSQQAAPKTAADTAQ